MTPSPFVEREPAEHAWVPCKFCGSLTYEGIQHDCREGADEQTSPYELALTLACIAAILAVLVLLLGGWWNPGWPHRG